MNNTTFIPYQRLELQSMGTEKLLNIIESFNIAISFIGERKGVTQKPRGFAVILLLRI